MEVKADTLESLCELIVDCPHSTPKWTDEGIVVLRNQNIRNGVLDLSDPSFTNEEDYQKRIKRAVPQAGDIIFTREAPMGEVCLIPEGLKCCLGQRQVLLRPRNDISGEYLFWALQSPYVQHQISWNEGTGTTVSNVRIPVLKALKIPRHPQDEARAAGILSALANKIQLNRQTNQTLENMAQALFKSWFVDFDPVIDNALAAGNDIPEPLLARAEQRKALRDAFEKQETLSDSSEKKEPAPLPESIRQLFPDGFVFDADMGWIPEGWNSTNLGSLVTVKRGGSPRPIKDFIVDDGLPWVKISDATASSSRFISGTKEFIREEGLKKTIYLKKGSLILSNSATPGLPKFLDLDACIHDGWLYFPAKEKFSDTYLYQLFLVIRDELVMQGNGSVFTNLKTDILKAHKLIVPSDEVLAFFDEMAVSFHTRVLALEEQTLSLTKLRDTLLPKLISGELRLPSETSEAQQQTEG